MVRKLRERILTVCTVLVICASLICGIVFPVLKNVDVSALANTSNSRYLSDMDWESNSLAGWVNADFPQGHLAKDNNTVGGQITVKIGNVWRSFDKGLFTHAEANVYYNIENCGYKYLTAYVGMDKICGKNTNGTKFFVYTSNDDTLDENTSWTLKTAEQPTLMTLGHEAEFLSADIRGAKWLRLYVDPNGAGAGDYAVWADAKLTNSASGNEMLDYYDEQIKDKGTGNVESDADLELLVLQREFVRKAGQDTLNRFENESEDNKALLNWLLNDLDVLREFMIGGAPGYGNYYNSLTVLSDLYRNYKTDLDNTELLHNKWKPERTYGDLYRTMMFSIALTHDVTVGSWMQKERVENQSDPVRRYAIYRYLHNTGRFIATLNEDGTPAYETQSLFESLTVEEMRWIMYDIIDDESIIWLNDYVQTKINEMPGSVGGLHTPHGYVAYTTPNYGNPVYYAAENEEYFNDLFAVDDREHPGEKIGMWDTSYIIPGGVDHESYTLTITKSTETNKIQKVWMNFRNKFGTGSVCGGISKSGTNIRGVRGIPCTVIGQPGHAAMLCYWKNSEGMGYWGIDNNVSGWTLSTKNERHLLGWGNESWQRTHATIVYFNLAQDALNDYDNYVKAEENVMLAKVYEGDTAKQEELYERALTYQPINIDAWYGLIKTYEAKKVTQDKYIELTKRIADTMVGYPLPMHDLFKVIEPLLEDTEYVYQLTLFKNKALTASSVLPNTATDKTLQPAVARVEALFLLGDSDSSIADFSFDGENAGAIVWAERFDNTGIRWKYSLDNKKTWKEISFTAEEPHIHKLTAAELANVSEENDIYIHIVGVPESEENYFKIDISSKPTLPGTLFANDYENKVFGLDERFEWRYSEEDAWVSYSESQPDCSGVKTVEVRLKASGGNPPSDPQAFHFTADTDNETRKYVSISHLSVEGFSSQSKDPKRPNYAVNAIDGNINTFWHTDYGENILTSGNNPYLIIKLDSPKYLSGLDLAQRQYNPKINIFAKNIKVSVSEDGENWKQVALLENLEEADDLRTIALEESVYGQYIKIEMDTYGIFTTVSMVNVYEDATKNITPDNPDKPDDGNNTNGDNTTPQPPKDNNVALIVVPIVVGVVVVAGAAVAGVIIVKRKKKK